MSKSAKYLNPLDSLEPLATFITADTYLTVNPNHQQIYTSRLMTHALVDGSNYSSDQDQEVLEYTTIEETSYSTINNEKFL